MIPRTFWRIWLDEEVPERYEAFWDTFKALHPSWEFVTIARTEDLVFMRPHIRAVFDQCTTHAGRSDVVRYEAVYQLGGVYVDCDVEALKPFDPLVDTDKAFAGWEDSRMICPTVIGAPAGHPALGELLDVLPEWFDAHRDEPPNVSTGPHLMTRLWRWRDDVTLYPPVTFYSVHWSEKKRLGGPYPEEAVSIHHWDARWLPGGPPQRE
jgi:mannosyltransferase OCH1-like enzyme